MMIQQEHLHNWFSLVWMIDTQENDEKNASTMGKP